MAAAAAASTTVSTKEADEAMMMRLTGAQGSAFLDDLYNSREVLVLDGLDSAEHEFNGVAAAAEPRRGRARRGGGADASAAVSAEIAKGLDEYSDAVLDGHEAVSEVLHQFATKNVFRLRPEERPGLVAMLDPAPRPSRVHSEAEYTAAAGRTAELEAAVLSEARRLRALRHVRALYERRVPAAEEAAARLEGVAAAFAEHGATAESVAEFAEDAGRLEELTARLAAALPALGPVLPTASASSSAAAGAAPKGGAGLPPSSAASAAATVVAAATTAAPTAAAAAAAEAPSIEAARGADAEPPPTPGTAELGEYGAHMRAVLGGGGI